jgi:hypothetical protein
MGKTTKVIIATLSGFIIAFFAEPVKNFFQHRTKLKNLKTALYKEVIHNYTKISKLRPDGPDPADRKQFRQYLGHYGLRIECYRNALQNELSLFYELSEANVFNELQGSLLSMVMDVPVDGKSLAAQEPAKELTFSIFDSMTRVYQEYFAYSFYKDALDKKIIEGSVTNEEYQQIIEKGKQASLRKETT